MKVAIIGSRNLTVKDLGQYLPEGTTEIVSGGAKGVDTCAREYALAKGDVYKRQCHHSAGRGASLFDQLSEDRAQAVCA